MAEDSNRSEQTERILILTFEDDQELKFKMTGKFTNKLTGESGDKKILMAEYAVLDGDGNITDRENALLEW